MKNPKKQLKSSLEGQFNREDLKDLEAVELIKNNQSNNPRAYAHIMHKYKEVLYIKVYNVFKDEEITKDVIQEIFIKIYEKIPMYQKKFTFNSWFTRVADNFIIDIIRKRKHDRDKFISVDEIINGTDVSISNILQTEELPDFDEMTYEKEHDMTYNKAAEVIHQFNEIDQVILALFYREKKRQEEIASTLGLTHGAVRLRLHRMKCKIKEFVGENFEFKCVA